MIQRIQSVYYLLAIVSALLTIFMPLATYVDAQNEILSQLYGYGLMGINGDFLKCPWGIVIFAINCIVWLVVCLLSYKNRVRQIKRTNIVMILLLHLIIATVAYAWSYAESTQGSLMASYGLPFPLISMLFAWLARKNVKKDEDLVRAADRIR